MYKILDYTYCENLFSQSKTAESEHGTQWSKFFRHEICDFCISGRLEKILQGRVTKNFITSAVGTSDEILSHKSLQNLF